jgi:molybdopterin adenylyltransferase
VIHRPLKIDRFRLTSRGSIIVPMATDNVIARGCGLVTISASHSADTDESGTIAHDALVAAGHRVVLQRWVPDDLTNIRYLFREWVDDSRIDVMIGIGGTGLDASDETPEALGPLVTKAMPGFGELFRALAFQELGVLALETRAMAAVCHSTLVYLIPGVPQGVALALNRLILPQLAARVPTERLRPTMMPPIRKPTTPMS